MWLICFIVKRPDRVCGFLSAFACWWCSRPEVLIFRPEAAQSASALPGPNSQDLTRHGESARGACGSVSGRVPPGSRGLQRKRRIPQSPSKTAVLLRFIMNFFLETIQVLLLSIWFNVESFIHLFVPRKKKNISGEVVLITGAGSGIGRLMAQEFAALGTVLVLWDINKEGVKETARLAQSNGAVKVHHYVCDCSDKNEVYRVADQVKREVGDISILVNNAGIVTGKKFIDSPDSLIEKTMEVNTMAHFWTYKAFLPAMIANNHGHLVSIASSAGLIGVNGLADYCASKFGAVGFAESVGLELLAIGKDGVKTTIVCPYFINTGMFDGCQTKWPTVLPILDPHYVVKKIVNAVLTDQVYLLLPRSMYIITALKNVLPMKQGLLLGRYLGAFNLMDTFRGRSRKQD